MIFFRILFFKRITFILLNCLLLFSCGRVDKVLTPSDSAPEKKIDVTKIPNAVPKIEPKSRYGNPASYVVFGNVIMLWIAAGGMSKKVLRHGTGLNFMEEELLVAKLMICTQ